MKREQRVDLEDLRDDCIAVVLNSGLSFKDVEEAGGPTSQTTSKWLYKETHFPQLATARSMLNACGYDLTVTPKEKSAAVDHIINSIKPRTDQNLPTRGAQLRNWNRERRSLNRARRLQRSS